MKQHISHDTTANIQIFPHNLLTNLTTKLTAGIHPAAHSLVVETNRHAPLILLLLLLFPIILPIPKSFDSTTFNIKQLIMDINSIEYNCKQVIVVFLLMSLHADVSMSKIMRVELVDRCIAIQSKPMRVKDYLQYFSNSDEVLWWA